MKNFPRTKAAVAAVVLLAPTVVRAQHVLLGADTQISSTSPSNNYGSIGTATVSPTSSVLLSFDLRDVLPAGTTAAQVINAKLIIYPNSLTTTGTFSIYQITGNWGEHSVTYASKPTIAASTAGSASAVGSSAYSAIGVTALVQSWLTTPSSNHGLELKAVGSTNFTIDTKESTLTSHPPVLQVDLSGPAGSIGPAGSQGPQGAKGAIGATGPQGPSGSLILPYAGSGTGTAKAVFSATNLGVYENAAPYTPDGIAGYGGGSGTVSYSTGGTGLVGYGGAAANTASESTYGGIGILAQGGLGNPSGTGSSGGFGGEFYGGDSGGGYSGFGGDGVVARAGSPNGIGLYVYSAGETTANTAAVFIGAVDVYGAMYKSSGAFKIDHPVDPANKYLVHSFVESPDMMNVYNGNVVTDGGGTAIVALPEWFESLNRDFRYQLTPIGQFAQAMVASEIANGKFIIRTDKGNVKVSWQVTGIRQDAWANAHRLPTEVEKPEQERGHYIHPELFGHAGEASIAEITHPRQKVIAPPQ